VLGGLVSGRGGGAKLEKRQAGAAGNFSMSLPFEEKVLRLLKTQGIPSKPLCGLWIWVMYCLWEESGSRRGRNR